MENIELIKEKLVRKFIKKHLVNEMKTKEKHISVIRHLVSKFLKESQFHNSTGLNTLEALLVQLLTKKPSEGGEIGSTYKSLTTSTKQRQSYRKHLMLWIKQLIENYFSEQEMVEKVETSIKNDNKFKIIDEDEPLNVNEWKIVFNDEEGLENSNNSDVSSHYTFKDLNKEMENIDSFTKISGEDKTGMNVAEKVFNRIQKPILDALSKLADELDQKIFSLFLLKNLDKRFDEWEEQISKK